MSEQPVRIVPKIVKATRKIGTVSHGLPNIPAGVLYYMGYQKTAGSQKHGGPSGRRAYRFYQARYKSKAGK